MTYEDADCACHLNPPCDRCVSMPTEEDYQEALKIVEGENS